MGINWNLLDTQYPSKLASLFNPSDISQRQNAESNAEMRNQLTLAQLMQGANQLNRAPELQRREDEQYQQSQMAAKQKQAALASLPQEDRSALLMGMPYDKILERKQQQQIMGEMAPAFGGQPAPRPLQGRVSGNFDTSPQGMAQLQQDLSHLPESERAGVMEAMTQQGLIPPPVTQPDYQKIRDIAARGTAGGVKGMEHLLKFGEEKQIDPNKPFLMVNGKIVPNPDYQNYELEKARAGSAKQTTIVNPAVDPFKNEKALREEYQGLPQVKSASEMNSAFKMIETAYQRPSAANDLAMATKYMKILDPTSVVRESEFAMAVNATGLMDKVYNYANMIKTGQRLNPTQRKDFYDSAKAINEAFQGEAQHVGQRYQGIAGQYGLDPSNITFGTDFAKSKVQSNPSMPKPGIIQQGYRFKGGDPADKANWEKQ